MQGFPGAKDGAGVTGAGATGESCPVANWDLDTRMAMALYERSCPCGDLDYMALNTALNDLEIPMHKRRLMRRIIPAIHREIKDYHRPKTED
ncbi:MAG: hypothetical protein Q7W05_12790 [Deltaproteobacteria bacterium]|nr:hypothetical protein [Deltaproteobacteria bacterium]